MTPNPIITIEFKWLLSCVALALGEYIGLKTPFMASLWPFFALACALVILFGYGLDVAGWWLAALFLAGATLAFCEMDRRLTVLDQAFKIGGSRPLQVVITPESDAKEYIRESDGMRRVSFIGSIGNLPVRVCGSLDPCVPAPKAGECWRCSGFLDGVNDADVLKRRTLWASGRGCCMERVAPAPDDFHALMRRSRANVSRRLGVCLEKDDETAALCRAILLGERDALAPDTRRAFVDSGTMHVFAISGLHVMVIAKVLSLIATLMFFSIRYAWMLVVPATWLYVAMIGFPPSAVRAVTMASFAYIAPFFFCRPNWLVAWSITFIAAHILYPANLVRPGSALSFAVMLALVLFQRFDAAARRRHGGVGSVLAVSFVAWAAGVPIAARLFGNIAFGGIVTNIVMVPAAAGATVSAAAAVVASFVSERLALYAAGCAGLILQSMTALAFIVSRLPGLHFAVRKWTLLQCFGWYFTIGACIWLVFNFIYRRHTEI